MPNKAVSSIYGEIKKMLLTYSVYSPLSDIILQRYNGIFESLETNVKYIILAYQGAHDAIKRTASNAGICEDKFSSG